MEIEFFARSNMVSMVRDCCHTNCLDYFIPEAQKEIVREYSKAIRHITEPSIELCKIAISDDPTNLQYIKNQTEELCKLAIQMRGDCLRYVIDQTEEICIMAVSKYADAIKYAKIRTPAVYKAALIQSMKEFSLGHDIFDDTIDVINMFEQEGDVK